MVEREAAADARAVQDRILQAEAQELADLAERVARAGAVRGPETTTETVRETPQEHVLSEWNRAFSTPAGTAALGLPGGSRGRAVPHGPTGIRVQIRVPMGTDLPAAAAAVQRAAEARRWGQTMVAFIDASRFTLTREIVGEDPLTPWRVAGKTALAVATGDPAHVRRLLWERAGLTVKRSDGKVLYPEVLELSVGPRGPEVLVKLPGGVGVDAAVKTVGSLRSLFRCPELACEAEGTHLRIRLCTVPAETLPQMVPLWPRSLYRPTTPEQAIAVGKRIALPVGVTLAGDRLERIEIRPAAVPHGVLVGAPGSGKSRWVRGAMTAWTVQGGLLAIGDPKNGELVQDWLPGCVHISTSKATIFRLLLWAQVEMKRRLAVQNILQRRHGIADLPVQPILVVVDEFGQLMTELDQSTDPADKAARSEVERVVTNALQVGRSVGIHLLLITQNALTASLPGGIAQAASFRVSVGRPTEGASGSGSVGRLFPAAMRDRAAELGASIPTDSPGLLLTDHRGRPVIARGFYGYTPGIEPEGREFSDPTHQKYQNLSAEIRESWVQTRATLAHVPPTIRFGWRPGPDAPDDWQALSLSAGKRGDDPTVAVLHPVPLDRLDHATGRVVPIGEHARFDPLSDAYEGGYDPIDLTTHFAPRSY
ncbi:hypothetical protein GCM10023147_45070 [Tsukamurella soli]|uniref:FtsK domain-containing protein n=1 Tax=Tsukamurella soli TaxID=644556 RepID=A0ABP8KCF1_9ACTN